MSDVLISRRCPNCGASIRRSGSFCPQCGSRVAAARAGEDAGSPKPESKAETENPVEHRKGTALTDSIVNRPSEVAEPKRGASPVISSAVPNGLRESKKQIVPQPARRDPGSSFQSEHIRRRSQIVTSGESIDSSIRFLVVAIVLFLGFLVLLIVSQSMR
jgi:hypothetical protein